MTSRYHPYRHRRPRYRGKPAPISRPRQLRDYLLFLDGIVNRILTDYWKRAIKENRGKVSVAKEDIAR